MLPPAPPIIGEEAAREDAATPSEGGESRGGSDAGGRGRGARGGGRGARASPRRAQKRAPPVPPAGVTVDSDAGERPSRRRKASEIGGGVDEPLLPTNGTGAASAASAASAATVASTLAADAVGGVGTERAAAGDEEVAPAAVAVGSEEQQRLQRELDQTREQCAQHRRRREGATERLKGSRQALAQALVQLARSEDADERDRIEAEKRQLGRCRQTVTVGFCKTEWDGGDEADELAREKERIREDKHVIERNRRALTKPKRSTARASSVCTSTGGAPGAAAGGGEDGANATPPEDNGEEFEDTWEMREIFVYRMSSLNREEAALKDRDNRLAIDRDLHKKRLQRLEAADRSSFRDYRRVGTGGNERYQLLNMIGRGGFSEVYRAYDLENNQFCAVKIHELSSEMSDQQRQSYIRRAMREYEIQKGLKHPRVVTLFDCFAISTKAFGTVLELCEGDTLDAYLKRYGALPEKEARGIIIQLLSGLRYMNTNGKMVIHYDIKPANIFFRFGELKIADFGLSKVVHEENDGASIELTSQGAGTYWYLPPECIYTRSDEITKISNKVDVWSTGVVFFELLFKKRPFGQGQPQEALVRAAMAGISFEVEIPPTPKVPDAAVAFLRRLLTVNREQRPDVHEAFSDPYLRPRAKSAPGNAIVQAGVAGPLAAPAATTSVAAPVCAAAGAGAPPPVAAA